MIYDYYASGAEDQWTLQENRNAFSRILISTACLLVILSQVYRPSFVFLSLLALDIASHWFQCTGMYVTLISVCCHLIVSWILNLYQLFVEVAKNG